ncbi:CLIP-associating protein 2-like isoform X3 [Dendronephthya gigantea]|uniref:CLIP-associating protein 2-like isoform X3 n=1 Tax=Dendronephthya gigantea TaxID=151771 RepID=UPI001069CF65|nr:CLIP-associating protein 2-like isoform X3 [Dendronephthya gigantea]
MENETFSTLSKEYYEILHDIDNICQTFRHQGPVKVNGEVSEPVKTRTGNSSLKRSNSRNEPRSEGSSTSGLAAGAVDENYFIRAYTDTPTVQIGSAKELAEELTKISNALSSPSDDWEDHVAALKRVRSLVDGGSLDYDFVTQLKPLEGSFNVAVKSLRSAVAREACVTLSYLATKLGNKFGPLADGVLPTIIDLNANTATKIMASSGDTCARIVIKNTHFPRLIPHITTRMTSRSTPVRIRCADYVSLLLEYWELHYLKSHVGEIENVVRNGLSDASSDVRAMIRRAFWQFSKLFKEKADKMFNDLDSSKQKLLEGDKKSLNVDGPSSAPPTKTVRSSKASTRTRPPSTTSSISSASSSSLPSSRPSRTDVPSNNKPTRANSMREESRHTAAASPGRRALSTKKSGTTTPNKMIGRSVSNIDTRAAERARLRRRSQTEGLAQARNQTNDARQRPSRSATKVVHRGYMSQPASRSTSPSRLNNAFSPKERSEVYSKIYSPMKSKIPTPNSRSASRSSSRASSRDPSPTREHGLRSFSSSSLNARKPTHVRRLDTKDFTEAAVWDAFASKSSRPRNYSFNSTTSEDQDDGSDTSSIHSDRSNSSLSTTLEISEITRLCQSNAWSERRDALNAIQAYLRSSRILSHTEIVQFLECFNRFFYDPHNKVYSAFLDTLTDFMVIHKADLNEWLFILLTRLLCKLGGDLLASVHSKVVRVLDVVRDSFPYDIQFSVMTRFISDNKQIPNAKVKVAILQYLQGLIARMDPADFVNSAETRLTVSRFITWNSDPKSAEVRKESANVVIALFELNTPIFSSMLPHFPKSFHDGASKLIRNHLKKVNKDAKLFTSNSLDEVDNPPHSPGRLGYRSIPPIVQKQSNREDELAHDSALHDAAGDDSAPDVFLRENSATSLHSNDSFDSLEGVKRNLNNHAENSPSITSSGYHSDEIHTNEAVTVNGNTSPPRVSGVSTLSSSPSHPAHNVSTYDATRYQDKATPEEVTSGEPTLPSESPVNGIGTVRDSVATVPTNESSDTFNKAIQDDAESIHQLLLLLSDTSIEVKQNALTDLMKLARESSPSLWENQFKDILMSVVEKMKDPEASIRTLAVRVVRDMVKAQPYSFNELNGLVISEVLNLHQDEDKGVTRAAEEAAATFSKSISPDECMTVLSPLISGSSYPVNLAGIKMLTKALEDVDHTTVEINLPLLVPPLLKCYDHSESSVRKASVFSLVAIHNIVGEPVIRPYLQELPATKMKLLNLYIKRSHSGAGSES